jgi:hypothetical protein
MKVNYKCKGKGRLVANNLPLPSFRDKLMPLTIPKSNKKTWIQFYKRIMDASVEWIPILPPDDRRFYFQFRLSGGAGISLGFRADNGSIFNFDIPGSVLVLNSPDWSEVVKREILVIPGVSDIEFVEGLIIE